MAALVGWLKANGMANKDMTHLSLVGGRWSLPANLEGAFLHKYANSVSRGDTLHLTELKTAVFKLFVDLDWKSPVPVSQAQQLEVARFVAQQVFLIWELLEPVEVVVCCRETVQQADGLFKSGLHIHWPTITTDVAAALAFRQAAVDRCMEHFTEDLLGSPWATVIDEHVFRASGLRMLYSCKKAQDDVYRPTWAITLSCEDEGGLQRPCVQVADCGQDSMLSWIRKCSIRYHGTIRTPVQAVVGEMEQKATHTKEESLQPHSSGLADLHKILPQCYAPCKFQKLLQGENGKYFLRTNSKTCLNLTPAPDGKPGAHKSNGIYFVVGPEDTYQACFCGCSTTDGRLKGPCKDFKSNGFPTPASLKASLWPPAGESSRAAIPTAATSHDIFQHFFQPPAPRPPARKRAKRKC